MILNNLVNIIMLFTGFKSKVVTILQEHIATKVQKILPKEIINLKGFLTRCTIEFKKSLLKIKIKMRMTRPHIKQRIKIDKVSFRTRILLLLNHKAAQLQVPQTLRLVGNKSTSNNF